MDDSQHQPGIAASGQADASPETEALDGAQSRPAADTEGRPSESQRQSRLGRLGWLSQPRLSRRLLAIIAASVALGLALGGVATGWWAADRWSPRSAPEISITVVAAASGAAESVTMPDVRGLSATDARQVLADAGLGSVAVTIQQQPWVGVAGTIIAQEPAGGQSATNAVTLVVAAAAVIPAVVGTDIGSATRALQALGAKVEVRRVFRTGIPTDQVLAVGPTAGKPVPATVVLTVSAPPATLPLTELRPIESDCSAASDLIINGQPFPNGLRCYADSSEAITVYLLGRHTVQLKATMGQLDTVEPGLTVHMEIVGDGKVLASATLGYGQSKAVSVSTAGVLRLELHVRLSPKPTSCCPNTTAAFGDIHVIGGATDIAALRLLNGD